MITDASASEILDKDWGINLKMFKQLLKKVQSSQEFKDFKSKHKNTFLFSAFFILNPELEVETEQLDYAIDNKNEKAATFIIDNVNNSKIKFKIDELEPKSHIIKIDHKIKVDVDDVVKTIRNQLE